VLAKHFPECNLTMALTELKLTVPTASAGCAKWISQQEPVVVAEALTLAELSFNTVRREISDSETSRLLQDLQRQLEDSRRIIDALQKVIKGIEVLRQSHPQLSPVMDEVPDDEPDESPDNTDWDSQGAKDFVAAYNTYLDLNVQQTEKERAGILHDDGWRAVLHL